MVEKVGVIGRIENHVFFSGREDEVIPTVSCRNIIYQKLKLKGKIATNRGVFKKNIYMVYIDSEILCN